MDLYYLPLCITWLKHIFKAGNIHIFLLPAKMQERHILSIIGPRDHFVLCLTVTVAIALSINPLYFLGVQNKQQVQIFQSVSEITNFNLSLS